MLPVKPWKLDAMARLFVSVFICVFMGSLLLTTLRYRPAAALAGAGFYGGLVLALACLAGALLIMRKPWRFESFLRQLTLLLILFYGGLIVGMFLQAKAGRSPAASIAQIVVGGLSFQGAALLLVWRFLREHDATWNESFGWSNKPGHALLLGVAIGLVFLPIGWGLQWGCAEIINRVPQLHLQAKEQEAVQTLQSAATGIDWISTGLIIVFLVPPAEELLFRGILYPAVKQKGYPRLALWTTALLFAAIHFNVVSFIPLTVLALVLTILYERTNNLLAPIAVHALFNAVNLGRLFWLQHSTGSTP
jgi:membrane protease YdiL (CAAX protease family)